MCNVALNKNIMVHIIQIYSGIICGRVLNGERYAQRFTDLNLSVVVYRLFHEDFSFQSFNPFSSED